MSKPRAPNQDHALSSGGRQRRRCVVGKKVTVNTPWYPITSNSRFNGGFNCSSSSWITSRRTFNYCRSVWTATRVLVGSQEF